jgi:hypothetical protein
MTVNELMIGNIVEYNDTSMTVLGIMQNSVILDGVNSLIDIELISPILLSENILLSIGFQLELTAKTRQYKKGLVRNNYVFDGRLKGKVFIAFANIVYENYDAIKYVHRIQNLITTTS